MVGERKILVSIKKEDQFSLKVLECAAELARKLNNSLIVLSVIQYDSSYASVDGVASDNLVREALKSIEGEVKGSLKKFIEENEMLKDLGIVTKVVIGDATEQILEIANKENATMIVIGNNCSGLGCRILGSTAFSLIQQANIPVTIVPFDEESKQAK